ncbi:MAG: hypothetical protein HQ567_33350, partial [Candidatus Nealsonbacteria bacterium]|nr:hypothetical protein [Candidatus Nealsonbacteria bacterium]
VGEAFDVDVRFADASGAGDPGAVFSGYADVAFDPTLLRIDGISYDSDYAYLRTDTIDNADGRASGVGATGGAADLPDTRLLTLHLTALATGPAALTSGRSDELVSQIVVSGNESDQRETTTFGGLEITVAASVVARHVFYDNSAFDDPGKGLGDDDAIAPDKEALRPGTPDGAAAVANYTSYSRGINGIMIDVAGLPDDYTPTAADFAFHVGNDNNPAGWAEVLAEPAITLRKGAGVYDSDRVTLTWGDDAVRNAWLEVTVKGERLGLSADDVFYLGNAVAEAGNSSLNATVTTTDLLLARNNPRSLVSSPAEITFPYDFDRDGHVNATDVLLARNNQTSFFNALNLIDLSDGAEEAQDAPLSELVWLSEFDQAAIQRPAEKDATTDAIDRLLATYWPA